MAGQDRWQLGVASPPGHDRLRRLVERIPRPLRFLTVGGLGLITDLGTFTIIFALGPHPLLARVVSLAAATLVTWRLNRALTFDQSGRRETQEAMRYALVTLIAQGTSYSIFAALLLTRLGTVPQLGLLIGAAIAAFISYNGHRLFAFKAKHAGAQVRAP
jgi:putative flippase GtrA